VFGESFELLSVIALEKPEFSSSVESFTAAPF